jgi:hypothetical protein
VPPGGAPAPGLGLGWESLGFGWDRGAGGRGADAVDPQLDAEAARDVAYFCDQDQWQIEGFPGFEPGEDAVGSEEAVVAELVQVVLARDHHQRQKLEQDDADHIDRPVHRVGRS